jgi:dolichyl-diphosphooligosaccharide--protein glycosyltransferase
MSQGRFSSKLMAGIILALLFGIGLYLRIYLPYDHVFSGDWIKFTGNDPYYHMRLVDNLLRHFPQFLAFDPYTFYPHGAPVGWPPFFDWLLASIIWIISLGSPSQHTIDIAGVYFPAVLGAITIIPVYFIGKELFNRWAGVISAGLITLLPGEFLGRSILGFTDHHVAETLFTTIVFLFLILAIKAARQRELTLDHIKRLEWATITRPLIYSLLTGIFLAIYLLTWVGGLLFVFIITIYFVAQFIIDHLRKEATDYIGIVGTLSMLTALAFSSPLLPQTWFRSLHLPSMLIAILIPIVLTGISRLMVSKGIKPVYYPLTLLGFGLAGLAIFYIVSPDLLSSIISKFNYLAPKGTSLTILEVQPLLFPFGNLTLKAAWANFTTAFFLSFISLGILIYLIIRRGNSEKSLLVVWSLLLLAVTLLGQRRFAYYLAVNIALLTGYLSTIIYYIVRFIIDYLRGKSTNYMSWQSLEYADFDVLITRPAELSIRVPRKRAKLKKRRETRFQPTITQVSLSLWIIAVFFLIFFPNIGRAIDTAKAARFTPSDAWHSSLSWLKENTPYPFGNPDAYYELYEPPPLGENYKYPESAYGIMAWWDYGHLITRISHRIPVSNPFQQGAAPAAQFFTAQDETTANKIMDDLGARYVIVDHETTGAMKFPTIITWAEKNLWDFYDIYHKPLGDRLLPVWVFYPEYYRSLLTRLYNFDGKAVIPESTTVISYQEKVSSDGTPYREIVNWESFPSYEEATAYISRQKSGNYRIASRDKFVSPLPLEALKNYRLIYSSDDGETQSVGLVPSVKIFEYAK